MSELIIPKPSTNGLYHSVEFSESKEQHDPVPCVRLYCTMINTAYNLQIRGTVPINKGNKLTKGNKARNLIATASLSWDDLVKIADYVDQVRKGKAE